MSAIKHLLNVRILDTQKKVCMTDLAANNTTRVDGVYLRTQGNPGKDRIALVLLNFDPILDTAWTDGTLADRRANTLGLHMPPAIIGGDTSEFIRGVVEAVGLLTRSREDPVEADAVIQEALARAKFALRNMDIRDLVDEYGERVHLFLVAGVVEYDSGAKTANTTRFFLRWSALTTTGPKPYPTGIPLSRSQPKSSTGE